MAKNKTKERTYLCIDLKSFYASVECVERGLNAMTTNLVVADASRTDKTICLAVSPSLKAHGISGRPRLFEVNQRVRQVNLERARRVGGCLNGDSSCDASELLLDPNKELSFIVARPRMALYIEYSTRIYQVYLKYVAPEDIHVYSIDEVFMDLTDYLETYRKTPEEIAREMIRDVLSTTGITATAGIGNNLYLAKIAMDIMAKKMKPDENGVRIAELDEITYRRELWNHRPLTDFWRVGRGYARKLEDHGIYTMGDIARCSIGKSNEVMNEDLLYRLFGVNAELLIDHAWGWEPCTMAQIKAYKPENNSVGAGQVLQEPYSWEKAKLVAREMTDQLVLDLVAKGLVTDQVTLTVGYDIENLTDPQRRRKYKGPVKTDHYGRQVPKHAHGTANLGRKTSSTKLIVSAMMDLYDRIVDPNLLVRRITVVAAHVISETAAAASLASQPVLEQLDLFTDYEALAKQRAEEEAELKDEKNLQKAMLAIKNKYGKNAILKAMNLEEGATAKERNNQIGGHKA
ncbi:MAG: DNA methylase [Firmicutes bacterium]|nr:DNA methylase [Bacillota bacterium]